NPRPTLSSPVVSLLNPPGGRNLLSPTSANFDVTRMDPDTLAKAFVDHYYSTFDANRAGLGNLYQENSMLTFEGQKIQGSTNIVAKLTSLPFQQCKHNVSTIDCQPSGPSGGMLVFVSGNLQLVGEQHALKFSQMFHLMPTPQGSFFVQNDIFRLNYA
uniref:NTF2 domain-containing protein n=2 Tax=Cucumis melo TaxID=3656 RepID=A0A9I9DG20_CUCME